MNSVVNWGSGILFLFQNCGKWQQFSSSFQLHLLQSAVNAGLVQCCCKYDAHDALLHRHMVQETMNPGKTSLKNKTFFPGLWKYYTFCEKHNGEGKKNERTKRKTNAERKRARLQSLKKLKEYNQI